MAERMRRLEACMRYDADRLIEIMANGCGTQIEINNLIDDYKERKRELRALELAFEEEYLVR